MHFSCSFELFSAVSQRDDACFRSGYYRYIVRICVFRIISCIDFSNAWPEGSLGRARYLPVTGLDVSRRGSTPQQSKYGGCPRHSLYHIPSTKYRESCIFFSWLMGALTRICRTSKKRGSEAVAILDYGFASTEHMLKLLPLRDTLLSQECHIHTECHILTSP